MEGVSEGVSECVSSVYVCSDWIREKGCYLV